MRTLLLALPLMIACLGCTNMQPIGPLSKSKPLPAATPDADIPPPPESTVRKPVPPAMLIVPGEVNSDNASAAAQKLANEFEYDWKTLPPPPKTAEVSRIKNGVKVQ
jgi:hypothetical protein